MRYLSALFVEIITIEFVRQIRHTRTSQSGDDHTTAVSRSKARVHERSLAEQSVGLGGVLVVSLKETFALKYPIPRLTRLLLCTIRTVEDQ